MKGQGWAVCRQREGKGSEVRVVGTLRVCARPGSKKCKRNGVERLILRGGVDV